jgi:hypothetical protein
MADCADPAEHALVFDRRNRQPLLTADECRDLRACRIHVVPRRGHMGERGHEDGGGLLALQRRRRFEGDRLRRREEGRAQSR